MPRKNTPNQSFTMFGVRVVLESEDREALKVVLTQYANWNAPELFDGSTSIYIVLRVYKVNENILADTSHVQGESLAITSGGVSASADGVTGRGCCAYPDGAIKGAAFAEMVNTIVLFLLAHRGRIPVHASAVMLGDIAVILAGKSGAGKSSLALAANRIGLPVLSDDTVFVQTSPGLRVWALTEAIHVFEKDAPADVAGGMRFRSGRWKRALAVGEPRHMAERSVLCVLEKGSTASLEPMDRDTAVKALTEAPEPGYEFYGDRSAIAIRALAEGGCWRLSLSNDPAEAMECLCQVFAPSDPVPQATSFHRRYLQLVEHIESGFPVTRWKMGDVDIWPLARMDLYLDMYWRTTGSTPPPIRAFPLRVVARAVRPLVNLWKSRRDLVHRISRPKRAHAIFLGDGVSLDRIDGAWHDRFGEPLMAALEGRGLDMFLMQSGDLSRLPWHRPTFAANLVEARGWLRNLVFRKPIELPGHEAVLRYLDINGVPAPSFTRQALVRRAAIVSATASSFERVLRRVKPAFAFVVTYYAGLGHAFVLACRRQGILSIDMQHCPQEGAHKAYGWSNVPERGYTTLPALFWNWTENDAANIRNWTDKLASPWHRSLHSGHTQLAFLAGKEPSQINTWAKYEALAGTGFDREILVALQPIAGHRACWNDLAGQIEASPSTWRWWIRRHPSSRAHQDAEFGRLLSIRKPNVMIDEASLLPLPVLLERMNAILSLASGAAAEAAEFGVPAFFMSEESRGMFEALIDRGNAVVIDVRDTNFEMARLNGNLPRKEPARQPNIGVTLRRLEDMAREYKALCEGQASSVDRNR